MVEGLDQIETALDVIKNELKMAAFDSLNKSGKVRLETPAKQKLTRDRHVDTGRLRASVKSNVESMGDLIVLECGTSVVYAAKIEFRYDSYINFAFVTNKDRIESDLERALKSKIRNMR